MNRLNARRNFLKGLVATAGAALLSPGLAGEAAGSGPRLSMVAARSRLRPHLAANLALGIRLGLEHSGKAGDVRLAETAAGSTALLRTAEATMRRDRPDHLLVMQHPGAAADLGKLARELNSSIMLIDPGTNVPRVSETDPLVELAGMRQWQADYALGRWAATQGARSAVIISSLYDTGYDLINACSAGFQSGGGVEPTVLLTDGPCDAGCSLDSTVDRATQLAPDVIHVLHSGREASQLLRALAADGGRLLTATSLSLDDAAGIGFYSASAWLDAEPQFQTAFQAATGELPDEAAVFGYRTGRSLAAGKGLPDPVQFELFEVVISDGRPARRVIGQLADESTGDPLLSELATAPRTGWSTPWLTI